MRSQGNSGYVWPFLWIGRQTRGRQSSHEVNGQPKRTCSGIDLLCRRAISISPWYRLARFSTRETLRHFHRSALVDGQAN